MHGTISTREPRRLAAVVEDVTYGDVCEVCGSTGPLALQQVGDDVDARFLLCAPCGTPAVNGGFARWLHQRTTDVVGYKGDADLWCPPCAALIYDRRVDGILRTILGGDAIDHEGNAVTPMFRSDVTSDDHCGRCGGELDPD